MLDECDAILRPLIGCSLIDVLYDLQGDSSRIDRTAYTQPALFAVEMALARMWESWGVRPAAVLGHSVGEYAAACFAGAFSLEDGLRLIARRAELMQGLDRRGQMAVVMTGEAEVAEFVAPYGERLAIAAINGPDSVVISGDELAVQETVSHFMARDIACQPLVVSHAFHSSHLDPILNEFRSFAAGLEFRPVSVPLVSNLHGRLLEPGEIPDADYWREHSRQCVQFSRGMAALAAAGCEAFVEIGPAPVLLGLGKKCLPPDFGAWLPSLRRGQDAWRILLASVAGLHVRGVTIDWRSL